MLTVVSGRPRLRIRLARCQAFPYASNGVSENPLDKTTTLERVEIHCILTMLWSALEYLDIVAAHGIVRANPEMNWSTTWRPQFGAAQHVELIPCCLFDPRTVVGCCRRPATDPQWRCHSSYLPYDPIDPTLRPHFPSFKAVTNSKYSEWLARLGLASAWYNRARCHSRPHLGGTYSLSASRCFRQRFGVPLSCSE